MKISSLCFGGGLNSNSPFRYELDTDTILPLIESRADPLPVAYLIKAGDVPRLREIEFIVDRGIKHPSKSLSSYLLEVRAKVPVIEARFTVPGRAIQGVQALLRNACDQGVLNAFLIGIPSELFAAMEANEAKLQDAGSGKDGRELGASGSSVGVGTGLMDLLREREVPKDLVDAYAGNCMAVKLVRQLILRATEAECAVLIQGDTGTGKDIVARSIHWNSSRKHEAFVAVNCAGIPSELLESELFGHKKGSFTGAVGDKVGLWASAGRGTLFLDEVGDLALAHQPRILRALERNVIRPVGSNEEIKVCARVIAATNRDLSALVETGQFREDLYYRLRGFRIRTPSLREHPEDIPVLAQIVWRRITGSRKSILPDEILTELQNLSWPGNVRHLHTVLAMLHSLFSRDGSRLTVKHLQAVIRFEYGDIQGIPRSSSGPGDAAVVILSLEHLRRVRDTAQACRATLKSLGYSSSDNTVYDASLAAAVAHQAAELRVLCDSPMLFCDENLFRTTHSLVGELTYFLGLLNRQQADRDCYRRTRLSKLIEEVIVALSREIGTLSKRVRADDQANLSSDELR